MSHDPLCPNAKGCSHDCGGCSCNADAFCQCALIVRVRADERNKIFTTLDKMADSAHTDDCRDLTCGGCEEVVA